jgi:CRISPR system Cascade subunit CasE
MYLSRIELDFAKYETKRALGSPQILHAGVEGCRPHSLREESRGLWRVDCLNGRLYLLLLTPEKPDFTSFAAQFCPPGQRGEIKSCDGLLARIQTGQEWRFRLRANPAHSVKSDKNTPERGKVYGHVTVEQQKEWLRKKTHGCGFTLKSDENGNELFDVTQSEHIRFRRQDKYVTLAVATFEGILRITDAKMFTIALTEGIGRAKAYGCGLMTIARSS